MTGAADPALDLRPPSNGASSSHSREAPALLTVRSLEVSFASRSHLFAKTQRTRAVEGVDLDVYPAETVGLVGESGSGKSTTLRAVLGLVRPTGGSITVPPHDVTGFGRTVPRSYRRLVQAVFQDPLASLNPAMTVGDLVHETLRLRTPRPDRRQERDVTIGLLESVGLRAEHAERHAYELSGGQRQRVAVARAMAAQPRLVVLDEPVSALDVAVQSQVINLLEEIQRQSGVAYLFVAHDLAVVRHTSHRIAVMFRGRIVEEGPADDVCERPMHPYTCQLLESSPEPDPALQAQRRARRANGISPTNRPNGESGGCAYAYRCAHRTDRCSREQPVMVTVAPARRVACHLFEQVELQHSTDA